MQTPTPLEVHAAIADMNNPQDQVWETIANTVYYVPIHTDETNQTDNYRFDVNEISNSPMIIISEHPEKLQADTPVKTINMRGSTLIQQLNPTVSIGINRNRADILVLTPPTLNWLRDAMTPIE